MAALLNASGGKVGREGGGRCMGREGGRRGRGRGRGAGGGWGCWIASYIRTSLCSCDIQTHHLTHVLQSDTPPYSCDAIRHTILLV